MEIREFIATLKKSNFTLTVKDEKLILKGDKKNLTKDELNAVKSNEFVINYIRENKDQLVKYLSFFSDEPLLEKKSGNNISSIYRLSASQQGMLFHGLYDEAMAAYIEQFACDLIDVDLEILKLSWDYVIKAHSILRTSFNNDAFKVPVQCVYKTAKLPVELLDFRGMSDSEQALAVKDYEQADRVKGFDFKVAPLMRLGLLRLREDRYRMIWTSHHILFDGWSFPILIAEFLNTYELLKSGEEVIIGEEDRFEDYIRYIERIDKGLEELYWRNYLSGLEQSTLLPFIGATTDRNKGLGIYQSLLLDIDSVTTTHIQRFAQQNRLTVNTLIQGVWAYLLHRYTGSNRIVYGVIVSGRPDSLPGVEMRVGMFINTVPLHSMLDEGKTIVEWLKQLQDEQVSSRQYQHTPLQEIQQWTGIPGDMFDSIVVFENYPVSKLIATKQWKLQVENVQLTEQTNYPLCILVHNTDEINIRFSYNSRLLQEEYVQQIRSHFNHVLLQLIQFPGAYTGDIKLLTDTEKHRLLVDFNDTSTADQNQQTIVALFEEQVAKTPDAIAVQFEEEQVSYYELNQMANQFARHLMAKGVKEEMLVPICIKRSQKMIIGILGILKTGAAFVPMDPDYPIDRISYMLTDTAAKIVVTTKESRWKIDHNAGVEIVQLDIDWPLINEENANNVHYNISPRHLVYTIHTSGSTGMPKGVMIEHGAVVNLLKSVSQIAGFNPASVFLSVTTFSFDICYLEFFVPLINGGKLIVVPREIAVDGVSLSRTINAFEPTHMQGTPATWQLLLDAGWRNKEGMIIMIGGEAVKEEIKDTLTQIGEVYNLYGPTETTIWSACKKLETNQPVSIGRPISNTQIYILNEFQQIVPAGVAGEICIGGAGLARGYLNRPDLTTQKFISNPFSEIPGSRIYKTGDMGRWLQDGNLECLGRIDDQVKIRGYRIELGEIETVLMQSGLVNQAVVLAREDKTNNKRLIGYYVPKWQEIKKREIELYDRQVENWKEIYETEYAQGEASVDEEFDINIWKDSFTGKAIGNEQMQEWLQDIVAEIFSQSPGNVLEIGCGTGLIYYQLAGKVNKYIGTDFSESSIAHIKERIKKGLKDYGPTGLKVCAAHEISIEADERVDTIIMNSIVQYFPGEAYMDSVMSRCMSLLNGGGRVVIGDVRDNRLLELFKGRLQLQKLGHPADLKELEWAVSQEVLKEEELCFAPEYFYRLQSLYPQISNVEIKWKGSVNINELTLYRYTVVIHVGASLELIKPDWQDWKELDTKRFIVQQIEKSIPIIAVKNIPNFRLWQERLLSKAINEKSVGTVGALISLIEKNVGEDEGIKKILSVARANGYHTRLLLNEDPLQINIVMESHFSGQAIQQADWEAVHENRSLTNIPLFADISLLLQKDLKSLLKQRLPEYMVPPELVALRHLPLTNNGKVDRRFLSLREEKTASNQLNYQPPRTDIEKALAAIWQELLGIEQLGIQENFFEIGGHSLLAMRMVSAIRKELKVEMAIKSLFDHSTIAKLARHLRMNNSGLLLPPIEVQQRPEFIPLSYSQERLWFIDQLEGSVQYHIPAIFRLTGKLNEEGLAHAFQTVVDRYESLRSVMVTDEDNAYQKVMNASDWKLLFADGAAFKNDSEALHQYLHQLISEPFDLSKDYMLRATLVMLEKEEAIMVITMHHIASDGWSLPIVVKEVAELYASFVEGRPSKLAPLTVQYADFAIWQRNYLQGAVLDNKIAYWKEKLNAVSTLQLLVDFPRPSVQSTKGASVAMNISKELADEIQQLCREQGTTLFMTLLAAFKVLLHRYSGQDDICVGTPIAGRQQEEVESLVGFFVNTLALRTEVNDDATFTSLLADVKNTAMDAYEHQEAPFEKVVEVVVKERDMSRSPLFQVLFVLQNLPDAPTLKLPELILTGEALENPTSKYDISFYLTETPHGIQGSVEYCTDIYQEQTILRMIEHYRELLGSIVKIPEQKIGLLPMLTVAEEHQLLQTFNNTETSYPSTQSITGLFEEQSIKTPDEIAVVFEGQQISYEE
ncbi:MAG: amino acid adenylation domain-containing protein, partial [Ferruginibacter sp.]